MRGKFARYAAQRPRQLRLSKQRGIRKGRTERDNAWVFARLQHVENKGVDVYLLAQQQFLPARRLRQRLRTRRHVITGLRARNDPSLALQQLIRLHHRHQTQACAFTAFPQRRQLVPRPPYPVLDLFTNLLCKLLVSGHRP
ncbi:hypothetical protein D3C80_896520 [compost metagenome]